MIVEDNRNRISIGETAISDPEYSRHSQYFNYLIYDEGNKDKVITINSRIFYNAAHSQFLKEIYDLEINNESISMQSLLELRCNDYIQFYNQGQWQKVDDAEFDIKFLARKYNLFELEILPSYIEKDELKYVQEFLDEVSYQKEIDKMSESEKKELTILFRKLNTSSQKLHN